MTLFLASFKHWFLTNWSKTNIKTVFQESFNFFFYWSWMTELMQWLYLVAPYTKTSRRSWMNPGLHTLHNTTKIHCLLGCCCICCLLLADWPIHHLPSLSQVHSSLPPPYYPLCSGNFHALPPLCPSLTIKYPLSFCRPPSTLLALPPPPPPPPPPPRATAV